MKTPQRAAGPRSDWPRRLAWLALVPLLVIGLLLASVALPPVAAPAHELNAPAPGAVREGPPTRTGLLVAPSLHGLASPPSAAAAPTPAQIGAAVAAVNTLLLVPEPAPKASGAAGALALALLAGTRPMRRRTATTTTGFGGRAGSVERSCSCSRPRKNGRTATGRTWSAPPRWTAAIARPLWTSWRSSCAAGRKQPLAEIWPELKHYE